MKSERQTNIKSSTGRVVFVGISVLLQVAWVIGLFLWLNSYFAAISACTTVLALLMAVRIYSKPQNAAMKIPWIILILAAPVLGICLYLLCGRTGANRRMRRRFERVQKSLEGTLPQDPAVAKALEEQDLAVANQARYLRSCGFPVYRNTDVEYYSTAEEGIAAQKAELQKAERFIFMEYHAIEDSVSFREIEAILVEKARQGVEVRLFYDDMGSIGFINPAFVRHMRAQGVQCRVFNPLMPVANVFMNNRDHRKITVIDGKVGFVGGYNLADEYFHITQPYGYWMDTGVKLTGDAVRSLTVTFLENWNAIRNRDKDDADFETYLPDVEYTARESGFVQPYADSPLDNEQVGENVYINVLRNARRYAYFVTPYLIITDEMNHAFAMAAKSGVDVRIITPGIPDKKVVYNVTRSYYAGLVKNGVRIYEYTPGFCHAKQCVSDDKVATCGTINLDFRSLYHHFENGVLMYDCEAVGKIKDQFDALFPQCREVTEEYRTGRSSFLRLRQLILRLFAPLM